MDIQETIDIRYEEIEGLKQNLSEDHYMNPEQEDELEELITKAIKFGELCAKRDAKAQAVPEWISVQDKLPKFQQEVLILVGDEYLVAEYLPSATNEFEIQFKEGFWINGGASVVDADLWMSLPQPPKAQESTND